MNKNNETLSSNIYGVLLRLKKSCANIITGQCDERDFRDKS